MIQVTPEIAAGQFFDELIRADGEARPGADSLLKFLTDLSPEVLSEKRTALEAAIKSQGISFLVYSDSMNIDRSWPLDLVPRVMQASEWRHTEAGLKQRLEVVGQELNLTASLTSIWRLPTNVTSICNVSVCAHMSVNGSVAMTRINGALVKGGRDVIRRWGLEWGFGPLRQGTRHPEEQGLACPSQHCPWVRGLEVLGSEARRGQGCLWWQWSRFQQLEHVLQLPTRRW